MKRNPTLSEKKQLAKVGIIPEDWLVIKNCGAGLTLKHKYTGQRKVVPASLLDRR